MSAEAPWGAGAEEQAAVPEVPEEQPVEAAKEGAPDGMPAAAQDGTPDDAPAGGDAAVAEAPAIDLAGSDGIAAAGPTRRSFIAGGVAAVGLLAFGGASLAWGQSQQPLLRPPGAQDEQAFLASCIRCDRCRSACPHSAIGVAHVEDGILNIRTPKMDFNLGYCDFCNGEFLCAVNCPTQAIQFGFQPETDMIGLAAVDYEECLLYRSTSHLCSRQCVSACPYGAVLYDAADNALTVDTTRCNGCGVCEYVCPSASYGAYTSSGKRGINVEPWEGEDER